MKIIKNVFFLISLIVLFSCSSKEETEGCMNMLATNFNEDATISNPCLCEYNGLNASCNILHPTSISIPPIQQNTEVWCWLAVGEMIFRHYGLPTVNGAGNYQCGIVAAVGYSINGGCDACNINCGNCIRPAGDASMITHMLRVYPQVACRDLYTSNQTLNSTFISNYLTETALVTELDANRPVISGINPGSQFVLPGNSQHVAVITGYFYDAGNNLILYVNDPYPYAITGTDPYINNGAVTSGNLSYTIPYVNFVNGLLWNTAWYNIGW